MSETAKDEANRTAPTDGQASEQHIKSYDAPYLIYFGASAISPTDDEIKTAQSSDGPTTSPFEKYDQAVNLIRESGVPVRRYVRRFDEGNFLNRSREFRMEYLDWLQSQINQIKKTQTYVVYDAKRAPRWKSIRSFIVSPNGCVDILGDGESGTLIQGQTYAHATRHNAESYLFDAKSENNKPRQYSIDTVVDLEKNLKTLTALHDEKVAAEHGEAPE